MQVPLDMIEKDGREIHSVMKIELIKLSAGVPIFAKWQVTIA
jgi:hypothetical protein